MAGRQRPRSLSRRRFKHSLSRVLLESRRLQRPTDDVSRRLGFAGCFWLSGGRRTRAGAGFSFVCMRAPRISELGGWVRGRSGLGGRGAAERRDDTSRRAVRPLSPAYFVSQRLGTGDNISLSARFLYLNSRRWRECSPLGGRLVDEVGQRNVEASSQCSFSVGLLYLPLDSSLLRKSSASSLINTVTTTD